MNDKLQEVKNILNSDIKINLDDIIKNIKKEYKTELKGFKYVFYGESLINLKNKYIKYVNFSNKLYYGGFLYKTEKKNNKYYIYLINKYKQIWVIDFDNYYIFINDIVKNNFRNSLIKFLDNYTPKNNGS